MNPADPDDLPDFVASRLVAYDEALAGERSRNGEADADALIEADAKRLASLRHCLDRLERARLAWTSRTTLGETLSKASAETKAPVARERVGRFEIVRELGRGGCGIVFLAHDPRLGRLVALKVPRPEALVSAEMRERFLLEARVAARLDHSNLIAVHEVGQDGAVCYIASAYCEGPTLAQWLAGRGAPVPVRAAARLAADLADGVAYAHAHHVLHRDIKPSNVLLARIANAADSAVRRGETDWLSPRLSDFGLAKLLDVPSDATRTGTLLGTPAYMAPEQAQGAHSQVGPRTDVYALGAVLYETLVGRPPFRGAGEADTLRRVVSEEPTPPSRLRRDVPRDLEAICLRCLEKDPKARYASAGDLAEDLRRFLRDEPTAARPATPLQRAVRWARRRPVVAALAAASVLLLLGLTVGGWWSSALLEAAFRESQRQRKRAEAGENELQKRLYASDVHLAYEAWQVDDAREMRAYLARHIPEPGAEDRRGFAWRLLWALCHSERAVLEGHAGDVYAATISPDGRVYATAGKDGTIRIWDAQTLQPRLVLAEHRDEVNDLAFSPDGRLLASASDDGEVRLWDAQRGFSPRDVLKARKGVYAVAFSHDSARLACGGREGFVCIWDAATAETVAEQNLLARSIRDLSFSPDGRRLAAAGGDGVARIWNLEDFSEHSAFNPNASRCTAVAYSPDGQSIAAGFSDGVVRVWEADSGGLLATLSGHVAGVLSLAWSPDGALVASTAREGAIRVWNVLEERGVRLIGHDGGVWCCAFSPDGKRLVTAGADATARVFDADAVCVASSAPHGFLTNDVAFSPDGRWIAYAGGDRCVSVVDAATRQTRGVLGGHLDAVVRVVFSPDGDRLASVSWDGTVVIWDPASCRMVRRLEAHDTTAIDAAFSPDGKLLATVGVDRLAKVWDTVTWTPTREFKFPLGPTAICFSPDGRELAVTCGPELLRWNVADWRPLPSFCKQPWNVLAVAFSPDGRRIATAGADREVRLWDAADGTCIAVFPSRRSSATAVAFSPDGRELAVCSKEGPASVFDLATRQELLILEPGRDIAKIRYSPDGARLIACESGRECLVFLWSSVRTESNRTWRQVVAGQVADAPPPDAAAGAPGLLEAGGETHDLTPPWRSLPQQSTAVRAGAFTPDDRTLVICSSTGALRCWDVASGRLTAEFSVRRELRDKLNDLTITPDGGGVLTTNKGALCLWDLRSGRLRRRFGEQEHGADGNWKTVACTPDGRCVAAAGPDGTSCLYAIADGRVEVEWPGAFLALSHDGRVLASQSRESGALELRDANKGDVLLLVKDVADSLVQAEFSPDGKLLAGYGMRDGSLYVWDAAEGREIYILKGDVKSAATRALAFSPNGGLLATAGLDDVIRLREARTGKPLAELAAHSGRIDDLTFSSDGRRLASVGGSKFNNGEVFLWNVSAVLRNPIAAPKAPDDGDR